jgi:hypothetical protein
MLPQLNYKRAVATFLLAYIVVTILAIAFSVTIGIALNLPQTPEPMQNQAYLLSERFLPLLNLVVWGFFAWVYLGRRTHSQRSKVQDKARSETRSTTQSETRSDTRSEAIALGTFWLTAAAAVDYLFFVLIKNPLSLTPHDFYMGQFPWIYLIYSAIFLAPIATSAMSSPRRSTKSNL